MVLFVTVCFVPTLLNFVHGLVGDPDKAFRIQRIPRKDAHAYASCDFHSTAFDVERSVQYIIDNSYNMVGVFFVRERWQNDGKLIAANAGDDVAFAQAGAQSFCSLLQQQIPPRDHRYR